VTALGLRGRPFHSTAGSDGLPDLGGLPALGPATTWLHSAPLTPDDLRSRVVLVDFWTYTCVNWLRTLPYLRAWHERYAGAGLLVVGVHTPEFPFEHDLRNVTAQAQTLGIRFPVAVDSDYRIWDAFANAYWPAIHLADARGRIRHRHFGEGEYAQTEMAIQQLLTESGAEHVGDELVTVEPRGLEVAADWPTLRSPETYLGYGRSSGFVAADRRWHDVPHVYEGAAALPLNAWELSGSWTVSREAAALHEAGGTVSFVFHARDVNLIMGPATFGSAIRFRVSLDGEPPESARGEDVDVDGRGVAREQRTFQLIRQPGRIVDRRVEIDFVDPGVEVYCFTFG
jgi:thiol-disulfide isomerase/thioredoxin